LQRNLFLFGHRFGPRSLTPGGLGVRS